MFDYAVTADASRDLEEIENYIGSYAEPDYVDLISDAFEAAFGALCENPYARAVYQFERPVLTLHECRSVNVYNYKVFYRTDEAHNLIVIYRIRHMVSDFTREKL